MLFHYLYLDLQDDETTLLEEEELAKTENHDSVDEVNDLAAHFYLIITLIP